ncbi:MAG: YezD family protein [Methylococcales bacterium]
MSSETSVQNPGSGTSNQQLFNVIATALEGLRYGALEIIVHEGRVVQIERKEKLRFVGNFAAKPFGSANN